ncbi:hypothetical protein B0T17DRAFT_502823 [Bombardia bombarda]|uniref:Uncharacterized protein n=1 Tax=Bombardia bombarda TaxID=252184 RepID=A0AA39XJP7_9PEZI|nr:hypothetical protein B0T17DRAFT_502823 [Bombardia bombarda]
MVSSSGGEVGGGAVAGSYRNDASPKTSPHPPIHLHLRARTVTKQYIEETEASPLVLKLRAKPELVEVVERAVERGGGDRGDESYPLLPSYWAQLAHPSYLRLTGCPSEVTSMVGHNVSGNSQIQDKTPQIGYLGRMQLWPCMDGSGGWNQSAQLPSAVGSPAPSLGIVFGAGMPRSGSLASISKQGTRDRIGPSPLNIQKPRAQRSTRQEAEYLTSMASCQQEQGQQGQPAAPHHRVEPGSANL